MHTITSLLLFLIAPLAALCADHGANMGLRTHGHRARAYLASNELAQANNTYLAKRVTDADFTYYAAGQGACGKVNSASDFIVAMNAAQYGGGENCFKSITITAEGKSTQAQVVDLCPGCGYGGLDFSQGLFEFFAPTSKGVIHGQWAYADEKPTTTSTTQTPTSTSTHTTPTSTWTPTTTSTWVAPSTTSTSSSTPPPTTSSSSSVWSSSTSDAVASTGDVSASSVLPSATQPAAAAAETGASSDAGNLDMLNQIMLQMAVLVAQAPTAQ